MLRFLLLGMAVLAISATNAAPLKLEKLKVGAKVYSNVTVIGANTTDLYFTHANGITSVKLKNLEPALQERFNYDREAADEAERQQARDDAQYYNNIASNILAAAEKERIAARKAAGTSEDSLADPVSDKSLLGKTAPALEVEKWLGEKPVVKGKFTLLAFLEPWSIPCRKYLAELNAFQKKFGEKIVICGVSSEPAEQFETMPEPKADFPLGIDTKAKLSSLVGVTSVPYILLIDPKGVISYQGHPAAITEKKLEAIVVKVAEP